ncbi:MAG TPA: hypothetical protein VK191_16430 [Symbiobacteriaceae bacterium]|nr:hypothetical protein [Symbiobacteriaceae bacterium]
MSRKSSVPRYGKQAPEPKRRASRILWVAGGVVGLVALVIGLSLTLNRPAQTAPPVAATQSADRKAMGPTTAPVTLIEYGDFL